MINFSLLRRSMAPLFITFPSLLVVGNYRTLITELRPLRRTLNSAIAERLY